MSKKLNAKELIAIHQARLKPLNLPVKERRMIPTNSQDEIENTAKCLNILKDYLITKRVARRQNRIPAEWLPDKRLAKVTKKISCIYPQFGFLDNRELFLSPEEALYLMEVNKLELLWNDVPFSIEQAFTVFLDSVESLAKYRTFKEISAKGFLLKKSNNSTRKRTNESSSISDSKRIKSGDEFTDPDIELFERLKENGPSNSEININNSTTFNFFSSDSQEENFAVILKPKENTFSVKTMSQSDPVLTSFTENESVSFYQFHKVDLSENK